MMAQLFGAYPTNQDLQVRYRPARPIGCRLYNTGTQSVAAAGTTLTFDSEQYDTDGFHESVTNPGRITIPAGLGGYYWIGGLVEWDVLGVGQSGGMRTHWITLNGTATIPRGCIRVLLDAFASASVRQRFDSVFGPIALVAGDYVLLRAGHDEATNMTVYNGNTVFWARYAGT